MSASHHHHHHSHHHKKKTKSSVTSLDFFYNFFRGFSKTPEEVAEDKEHLYEVETRYFKAICLAIGSGGVYTPEQVRFLKGFAKISTRNPKMHDEQMVDDLLKESADLLDVELVCNSSHLTDLKLLENAGRIMVYDMYTCAAIADYPEPQMVAIALIAEELGVTKFGVLEAIKKQVDMEVEMRKNRIKLVFPDGHPLLEPRYADLHKEQGNEHQ